MLLWTCLWVLFALLVPYGLAFITIMLYSRKYDVSRLMRTVTELPTVSVVIPTYNEAAIVKKKIENTMQLDYPADKLELVVVDCSTDATPEIVQNLSKTYPQIRLIIETERKGLATSLNIGYSSSKGKVVVKSDCDAITLTNDALKRAVALLENPAIGGVTGTCIGENDVEASFRSLEVMQQKAESRIDSTIMAHGSFTAFRRDLMPTIDPTSSADDTELFMKVRRKGGRVVVDTGIRTYESYKNVPFRRLGQRSRRAGGIIRVLLENLDLFASDLDWRFSYVVYPMNLLTLLLLPWSLIFGMCASLLALWILSSQLAIGGVLLTLLVLGGFIVGRPRFLVSLLDIAVSSALGQLSILVGKRQHIWQKASTIEQPAGVVNSVHP
jgi:cellulose synthase/poly-beta-1,6-N-acetylglucosamine synthase-like glycosyltransferase